MQSDLLGITVAIGQNEKEKAKRESDGSSRPLLPLIEAFVLVYLGISNPSPRRPRDPKRKHVASF